MLVYPVVDDALSPDFPLGVELEVFVRREDAELFIEEVRGDDPEVAGYLRIEERDALMPLRAIYRRALSRGEVVVNPTAGLELPAWNGTRDRIASASEVVTSGRGERRGRVRS